MSALSSMLRACFVLAWLISVGALRHASLTMKKESNIVKSSGGVPIVPIDAKRPSM
jgi:hypothetical protein